MGCGRAGGGGVGEAAGTAACGKVVLASSGQEFDQLTGEEKERLAAQAESAGHGPCGLPCSSCAGACALRGSPSQ